jgi:hypothetical protein
MSAPPPDPVPIFRPSGELLPPVEAGRPVPPARPVPAGPVLGGPPRHLAPSRPGTTPPPPFHLPTTPGATSVPPGYPNGPYGGVPGVELPDYAAYIAQGRRAIGVIGLAVAVVGVVLVAVSFVDLTWLTSSGATTSFADLRDHYRSAPASVTALYFQWLGWALLAAVAILALLANVPTRLHPAWRVLGLVAGFAGVVLTFDAVYSGQISLDELRKHAGAGFWLAMAGFLLGGIGAVIGPRRAAI